MVGVLATLAGPLFRDFVIQQSIRNAAYELMSDLTYARSEAVKRNLSVTMSKTGTWTGGWKVAAGATTLRQHPALSPNITITMASSSVDFLLNGRASVLGQFHYRRRRRQGEHRCAVRVRRSRRPPAIRGGGVLP